MAVVTIITKNNDGAGVVPSPGSLVEGELAVNTTDRKLYTLNNAGSVVLLASGTSYSDPVVIDVSSASPAVRITQRGAGYALLVEDSANPDSTPFVIDATGRVNVGGTSWYSVGSVTPATQFNGSGTASSLGLNSWQTGVNVQSRLYFNRADSATQGDFTDAVDSGDNLGSIHWTGSDGTGFVEAASINAAVDGTPGTNDMPGRLVFSTTADGASSPTERMRITSLGTIGIGGSPANYQFLGFQGTAPVSSGLQEGFSARYTIPSGTTTSSDTFLSRPTTEAASFTLPTLRHFYANPASTFGAGSTVTDQYGFQVSANLTGATNNYGFFSNIASGTGRWNFYANGTADNFFGGDVIVDVSTTDAALRVTQRGAGNALLVEDSTNPDSTPFAVDAVGNVLVGGTASRGTTVGTAHLDLFNGTAPAGTLTNGVSLYSSSGDFSFMDSAGNGYKVGFRNVPAVGTKTSSYTLATADVGKYVQVGSGGSITIPNATFAEGDVISIFNNTSGNITITCSITTAYISGVDTDKATMTLATRGIATVFFISGTVCVVTGNVS